MIIVIDNSVLVKWYFPYAEELLTEALAIRDDFGRRLIELLAPSLITYELGNVLAKATHLKNLKSAQGEAMFALFLTSGIQLLDYEKLHEESLKISAQNQITFYDASYVALSLLEKAPLFTADRKLLQRVSRGYPLVKHLAEYSSPR